MGSGTTGGRLGAALGVREAAEAVASGEAPSDPVRARTVLTALESLAGCAAAVTRWDPLRGRHEVLASSGYGAAAVAALENSFHEDPLFAVVRRSGRPLRVRDIAPDRRTGPMFDQVIRPLAYTDGVSFCLSPSGRYVGAVHVSTSSSTTADGVDDEAVAWLRLLGPDLADLVDPLGGLAVPPAPAGAGVVAWSPADGRTVALTPDARPELVAPGAPLAGLLDRARWPSRLGRHLLVLRGSELLAVEARPAGPWVLVEHRAAASPADLSLRELEVLVELATGATNRIIARTLRITERTVATHVEHLLPKIGAGNRAGAAAFAVAAGLVRLPG